MKVINKSNPLDGDLEVKPPVPRDKNYLAGRLSLFKLHALHWYLENITPLSGDDIYIGSMPSLTDPLDILNQVVKGKINFFTPETKNLEAIEETIKDYLVSQESVINTKEIGTDTKTYFIVLFAAQVLRIILFRKAKITKADIPLRPRIVRYMLERALLFIYKLRSLLLLPMKKTFVFFQK